jgi:putative sterol carrier protein
VTAGEWLEGISFDLPDDVSVTFELRGEGGGTWTVTRASGRTAVARVDAASPDCRIACSVGDFVALLEGDLDVRHAFLAGRLGVEGDVGLALRLRRHSRPPPTRATAR